jgi:hypothetical protein
MEEVIFSLNKELARMHALLYRVEAREERDWAMAQIATITDALIKIGVEV